MNYGWQIFDLKIYDKPKPLSDFKAHNRHCKHNDLGFAIPKCGTFRACNLKLPPQSWCYVEGETT